MNLQAEVTLPLGDGRFLFSLKSKQLENLEKVCEASISEIAIRVIGLRPYYKELKNTIILGLEGGGMAPEQALFYFDRYIEGRPLMSKESTELALSPGLLAARIMEAAWFGVSDIAEEENSGKPDAAQPPAQE